MSATPILSPSPDPTPVGVKETPALTDAYQKAHRGYVLAAGLLVSWELIGITLNTKEKWGIELKSPAAVPLILFTLVFYSGYKTTIEWLQCDLKRRDHFAARVDFVIAHLIAVVAIGISVAQYLWRIRVMDKLAAVGQYTNGLLTRVEAMGWRSLLGLAFLSLMICFCQKELAGLWHKLGLLGMLFAVVIELGLLVGTISIGLYALRRGFLGFDLGFIVFLAWFAGLEALERIEKWNW